MGTGVRVGSNIYVYATRDDWLLMLGEYEQQESVRYVVRRPYPEPAPPSFPSAAALEGLGTASAGELVAETEYLILPARAELQVEPIRHPQGTMLYHVDDANNPGSVSFTPGGLFEGRCLVLGNVALGGRTPVARRLFRPLVKVVQRHCQAIRGHYLGPGALRLFREGMRLAPYADPRLGGALRPEDE